MRAPRNRIKSDGALFTDTVLNAFSFMIAIGFKVIEQAPTMIRFQRGTFGASVYMGRHSHELGFQMGNKDEQYSISEIIKLRERSIADEYRNTVVTKPEELVRAVARLAELVERYATPRLTDERSLLTALRRQRESWSVDYALDVLAEQIRPQAEAAFRGRQYREAAKLYERIAKRLTPTELKKLDMARKRSGLGSRGV